MPKKPTLKFVLSGGIATNSKAVSDATWDMAHKRLLQLKDFGGAMSLEIIEGGEFPFDSVHVEAENGHYLLTYLKHSSHSVSMVYYLFDIPDKADLGMVELGGYYWPAGVIGSDFSVVLRAFKDFYETGKIELSNYGVEGGRSSSKH